MQIYELRDALAAAESPALMLETLLPLTIDPLPLGKSGSETLWNGEGLLPIFPFDAPFETSEEIPARLPAGIRTTLRTRYHARIILNNSYKTSFLLSSLILKIF